MHRYRVDYESQSSADRYSNRGLHRYLRIERLYGRCVPRPETFMERVQRFLNENLFFRIEGVDSDEEQLTAIPERNGESEFDGVEGKGEKCLYDGVNLVPEAVVVVEGELPGKAGGGGALGTGTPEVVLTSHREPSQFSCLSISIYSAVIIAMICIFLFIGRDYVKYILFSLERADFWISLIVFCLLFTIVSFPMTWGYILLNVSAGYLYGLVPGLLIVISCALTGLFIAHCVIRRFLRNFVLSKFTNKSFVAIMNVVDHSSLGFKVVVWARLTPIPFGLQNALFAVCGISTPKYILASVLGMLPTQGMHAYIGSTLRSMEEVISNSTGSSMAYLVFGTQLLIAICLLCFVIRRARVEFNKMVQNAQNTQPTGVVVHADCPLKPSPNGNALCVDKGNINSHSRSASVPGALPNHTDRPRTSSFSPKHTRSHEH